jgi:hypothetical protein
MKAMASPSLSLFVVDYYSDKEDVLQVLMLWDGEVDGIKLGLGLALVKRKQQTSNYSELSVSILSLSLLLSNSPSLSYKSYIERNRHEQ